MSEKTLKDHDTTVPDNYQILAPDEVEEIMSGLGPYEEMTLDECRKLMDELLGDISLSESLIEMRREARY